MPFFIPYIPLWCVGFSCLAVCGFIQFICIQCNFPFFFFLHLSPHIFEHGAFALAVRKCTWLCVKSLLLIIIIISAHPNSRPLIYSVGRKMKLLFLSGSCSSLFRLLTLLCFSHSQLNHFFFNYNWKKCYETSRVKMENRQQSSKCNEQKLNN